MLHILRISYLNHIIHSMTRYTFIVERMYRIVNSNLYAIVLLPYLWRLQCVFLFNNIVYVFIMICKQYCWHSTTYLSQYVILFARALFDRMIFVFCCKACVYSPSLAQYFRSIVSLEVIYYQNCFSYLSKVFVLLSNNIYGLNLAA